MSLFALARALVALSFLSKAQAAIVVNTLPTPLTIIDNTGASFDPIDVDGNGSIDFTFASDFSSAVGVRTERFNRLIISPSSPPNVGGPAASLENGTLIGPNLITSSLEWISSDLQDGFVDGSEITAFISIVQVFFSGSNTDFNSRSSIGFEFETDDGTNYGYFDVSAADRSFASITLYGWAYETDPETAIFAGAVPEPSAFLLFMLGGCFIFRRYR